MISKLVFLATLATLATAWTDFHAMNPHHKSTELADGRIHTTHDVHHVFPEHGTYFKAKYEAIHHKKWHFVELHEHDVEFMKHVECGASDQELFVKNPSAKLRDALAKQNYEWTVLTAQPQFHCSENAIFRGVTGATYHADTDKLQVHTVGIRYEQVFEHLDMSLQTDHFEGQTLDMSDRDGANDLIAKLPQPEEDAAVAESKGHAMDSQWKWAKRLWKKVKSGAKKLINKGKAVVKKAVATVTQGVRKAKSFLSGDYSWNKSYKLKTLNYNKDVSRSFSRWNIVGDVRLAASANAVPTLVFNLKISKLKLTLSEAYFQMAYKGGIRIAFDSKFAFDKSDTKALSLINLDKLSFKIIAIPVVISITCPLVASYDIEVGGRLNFNFLLSAYGNIKLGMRYTNTRGFQVINEVPFNTQRDFSPRAYRYDVGLRAKVTTTFKADISFLGFVASSAEISAEAAIQENNFCAMLMTMNIQPIITAQYVLNVNVAGRTILDRKFGPKALVSWKKPILNYCIPKRTARPWGRKRVPAIPSGRGPRDRAQLLQADSGSANAGESAPVNSHTPDQTPPTKIDGNSTGITWESEIVECNGNSAVGTTLKFTMQFLTGNWTGELPNGTTVESTQMILTLLHNETLSAENGDYRLTNLQRTYAMNETLVAGFNGQVRLHREEDPEDEYDAVTNDTVQGSMPDIDEYISIKVDANDAEKLSVRANTMFCKNNGAAWLNMEAVKYSDDNSTFVIFYEGGGAEESETSLTEKLKAYIIYVPIVLCVVLGGILVAVLVSRKRAQAAHGANWAKSASDAPQPMMQQGPAVQNTQVNYAPAPVQDSRVSAL